MLLLFCFSLALRDSKGSFGLLLPFHSPIGDALPVILPGNSALRISVLYKGANGIKLSRPTTFSPSKHLYPTCSLLHCTNSLSLIIVVTNGAMGELFGVVPGAASQTHSSLPYPQLLTKGNDLRRQHAANYEARALPLLLDVARKDHFLSTPVLEVPWDELLNVAFPLSELRKYRFTAQDVETKLRALEIIKEDRFAIFDQEITTEVDFFRPLTRVWTAVLEAAKEYSQLRSRAPEPVQNIRAPPRTILSIGSRAYKLCIRQGIGLPFFLKA